MTGLLSLYSLKHLVRNISFVLLEFFVATFLERPSSDNSHCQYTLPLAFTREIKPQVVLRDKLSQLLDFGVALRWRQATFALSRLKELRTSWTGLQRNPPDTIVYLIINEVLNLATQLGIEPSFKVLEALVLPLNY